MKIRLHKTLSRLHLMNQFVSWDLVTIAALKKTSQCKRTERSSK